MCHQGDIPMRAHENDFQTILDDLELRDGEPIEGAGPYPDFIEYNNPVADLSDDLRDSLILQDLERIWPARQGRFPEIEITEAPQPLTERLREYFDQVRAPYPHIPKYTPYYSDYFLRRLRKHLPQKLDLDCWMAKLLIEHVAKIHSIKPDFIRPSPAGTRLTYEPGFPWLNYWHADKKQIATDLDTIPKFLAEIALEYVLWLPCEMQLISVQLDREGLDRYRLGLYTVEPRTLKPYSLNGESEYWNLFWSHSRNVLGYSWLELPFGPVVEW